MAGDWIKMRTVLQTSPKVVRIASALKADRLRTVGGLHAVWCLFDAHSEDGHLSGYTPEVLDEMIGWQGFTRAMEQVSWLFVGDDYLELPGFEAHNGQSAKRRAQEADRKRESRKTSAPNADKSVTREEKRREENIDTPNGVSGALAKPKQSKFVKPSLDDLTKAFTGRVTDPMHEANAFLNHYESNGWKVGKNPMKSWPHAVTNWITRSENYAARQPGGNKSFSRSEQNEESFRAYIAELDDREQESSGRGMADAPEPPPGSRAGRQH